MLISADFPENWGRQVGEDSNRRMTHTKCVNQQIILDLVYVPRVRLGTKEKRILTETNAQEVHLPTSQASTAETFQYVVSSGRELRELRADAGRKRHYRSAAS